MDFSGKIKLNPPPWSWTSLDIISILIRDDDGVVTGKDVQVEIEKLGL